MDIIVTTPTKQSKIAAQEAVEAVQNSDYYFRMFKTPPKNLLVGDKIFYVENGYIRGYAVVDKIHKVEQQVCQTTGRAWGPGVCVYMEARSWKWIKPIAMTGFQGWRYMKENNIEVIGDCFDSMPDVNNFL